MQINRTYVIKLIDSETKKLNRLVNEQLKIIKI